jgi:prepilin-type N-terminal cleavage/methylation domain-containing protein
MERWTTSAASARPSSRIRRRRAYSLLEVMIVIAMLAIVIALLLPGLQKIRRQAQITAQKNDLAAIAQGIDAYKNDFGWYPFYKDQQGQQSLADMLLGGRPSYRDGADGFGFRVSKDTSNLDPDQRGSGTAVGRVYGPYLQPEKWKIVELGGYTGGVRFLIDRWGGPIIYMPRRQQAVVTNRTIGARYNQGWTDLLNRNPDGSRGGGDSQFSYNDGWTCGPGMYEELFRAGIAYAFSVRLGDDDNSGYIDLNAGERLRFGGPYVLASGGPDGEDRTVTARGVTMGFGFEDFDLDGDGNVDPPIVDTSRFITQSRTIYRYCLRDQARKRIDQSDDVYFGMDR